MLLVVHVQYLSLYSESYEMLLRENMWKEKYNINALSVTHLLEQSYFSNRLEYNIKETKKKWQFSCSCLGYWI